MLHDAIRWIIFKLPEPIRDRLGIYSPSKGVIDMYLGRDTIDSRAALGVMSKMRKATQRSPELTAFSLGYLSADDMLGSED